MKDQEGKRTVGFKDQHSNVGKKVKHRISWKKQMGQKISFMISQVSPDFKVPGYSHIELNENKEIQAMEEPLPLQVQ